MRPVPRAAQSGVWVDDPLYRLEGLCLRGRHRVLVGGKFRWSDENIRLVHTIHSSFTETSFDQWQEWEKKRVTRPWAPRVWCPVCEMNVRMAPKGVKRV